MSKSPWTKWKDHPRSVIITAVITTIDSMTQQQRRDIANDIQECIAKRVERKHDQYVEEVLVAASTDYIS